MAFPIRAASVFNIILSFQTQQLFNIILSFPTQQLVPCFREHPESACIALAALGMFTASPEQRNPSPQSWRHLIRSIHINLVVVCWRRLPSRICSIHLCDVLIGQFLKLHQVEGYRTAYLPYHLHLSCFLPTTIAKEIWKFCSALASIFLLRYLSQICNTLIQHMCSKSIARQYSLAFLHLKNKWALSSSRRWQTGQNGISFNSSLG